MRRLLAGAVCASSLGVALVFGCTGGGDASGGATDAGQDAVVDSAPPMETGPIDAGPPTEWKPASGTYAVLCPTKLALKDPAQALRFYGEVSFVPYDTPVLVDSGNPEAGPIVLVGGLTMKLTPLQGWDLQSGNFITPPSVSATYYRTSAVSTQAPAAVDADGGRFTAGFGTGTFEAEANSVSGRELTIEQLTIQGLYASSPTRFCGRLGGHLTVPYAYDFVPEDNVCMFVKVTLGDPVPALTQDEFVCAY